MDILISIPRANTKRPVRRKGSLAHSLPCLRLVTLPTARRSTSLSAGYSRLTFIHQNERSHLIILDCFCVAGPWHSFLLFQKLYKAKFEKEKGKSEYNQMTAPPDVQHAMDVAKKQSSVSHTYLLTSLSIHRHVGIVSQLLVFPFCQFSYCVLSALLPNPTGFLQEGCQSQPTLHYRSRPSWHQEGYPGCQTYQRRNQTAHKTQWKIKTTVRLRYKYVPHYTY